MISFRHSGKLGDIIYSLPAVRALGGGIFYVDAATAYFEKPALGRETAQMMVDLLETQNYILALRFSMVKPLLVTSITSGAKQFPLTSLTLSTQRQIRSQVFSLGTLSKNFGKSLFRA